MGRIMETIQGSLYFNIKLKQEYEMMHKK